MIDCKKCENLIQKELDGEIGEHDAKTLAAHLKECSDCRKLREDYAALRKFFRTDQPLRPTVGLASKLTSRLPENPKVGFVEGYVVPFILQNRIRFALASFILVVAGFGLLFSFHQQDETLGGLLAPQQPMAESYVGIHSPGQPQFLIPTNDELNNINGEEDPYQKLEDIIKGDTKDSDIHLASD